MHNESTDLGSEIERDVQAAAIPAGDILDNSSIRGYEVRHAAGPDGITDTWDPARPVEVVVVGGRYVTESATFDEGARIAVTLGDILPANGRLQIAAEYDLAQEKARQLAPKITAANQRRLAEEARQREQFEQSLTPEQQRTLETIRAAWLAKQKKTAPSAAAQTPAASPGLDLTVRLAKLDQRIKLLLHAAEHGQPGTEEDINQTIKAASAAKAAELQKERAELAAQLPPRVIPPPAALPKPGPAAAASARLSVRQRLQELQDLMQEGLITPEVYNERQAQIASEL